MSWSLNNDTLNFIGQIETIAQHHGAHVALTGGVLYKSDERKDIDIMFYRIRQSSKIDSKALFEELATTLGISVTKGQGWVYKATCERGDIDFFFPEQYKHNAGQIGGGFDRREREHYSQ